MKERESVRRVRRGVGLAAAALLALAACGGGGGGGSGDGGGADLGALAGTWFGTMEAPGGTLHTLQVTLDGAGQLTGHAVDGAPTGLTGLVSVENAPNRIFSFVMSDGTEGGFYVDGAYAHAAFVDEDFTFGALQRGATQLPPGGFSNADVRSHSYLGRTVLVDADFNLALVLQSSATVDASGNFDSSDSNGVTASTDTVAIAISSATYGRYAGNFVNSIGSSGPIVAILTPDKTFAAVYAIWGAFPAEAAFSAWNRQ